MSNIVNVETEQELGGRTEGERRGVILPSLKVVAACFLLVALVLALGMTGGQVRELAGRVNALEDDRQVFLRRVDKLRGDNEQLIGRLRDYQQVLEVAQSSNISLSKRLENREMAVNDLQESLDVILTEKYATENKLRGQVAQLENLKRDLSAQVAALGEAVAAQSNEIAQLDSAYRAAERKVAHSGNRNSELLSENNRYLSMLTQMQDDLEAMHQENELMSERFVSLQSESQVLEAEKMAIEQELEIIKTSSSSPYSADQGTGDPFQYGAEEIPEESEVYQSEGEIVASAEGNPA